LIDYASSKRQITELPLARKCTIIAKALHHMNAGRTALATFRTTQWTRVLEAAAPSPGSELFEKHWALALLEQVGQRLRVEYVRNGKEEWFASLRVYLQGNRSGPPYAVVAAQYGTSEGAVKIAVHRMRQRYGELLRDEIARTAL
jgi:RNA polymerase sigma-70 factor (ECF subfamily)